MDDDSDNYEIYTMDNDSDIDERPSGCSGLETIWMENRDEMKDKVEPITDDSIINDGTDMKSIPIYMEDKVNNMDNIDDIVKPISNEFKKIKQRILDANIQDEEGCAIMDDTTDYDSMTVYMEDKVNNINNMENKVKPITNEFKKIKQRVLDDSIQEEERCAISPIPDLNPLGNGWSISAMLTPCSLLTSGHSTSSPPQITSSLKHQHYYDPTSKPIPKKKWEIPQKTGLDRHSGLYRSPNGGISPESLAHSLDGSSSQMLHGYLGPPGSIVAKRNIKFSLTTRCSQGPTGHNSDAQQPDPANIKIETVGKSKGDNEESNQSELQLQKPIDNNNKDFIKAFTTILSVEQRMKYKMEFNKHYNEYRKFHSILHRVSKKFTELEDKLKIYPRDSREFKQLQAEIVSEYAKSKQDTDYENARSQFQYLHEKVAHIKLLIHNYDTNAMPTQIEMKRKLKKRTKNVQQISKPKYFLSGERNGDPTYMKMIASTHSCLNFTQLTKLISDFLRLSCNLSFNLTHGTQLTSDPMTNSVVSPPSSLNNCVRQLETLTYSTLPESLTGLVHDMNIIFGLFDISPLKILTLLKKNGERKQMFLKTSQWKTQYVELIVQMDKKVTEELIDNFDLLEKDSICEKDSCKIAFSKMIEIIGNNYNDILIKLIPRYAVSLTDSVKRVFPENLNYITCAIFHIIHMYTKREYTNLASLKGAITDIISHGKSFTNQCKNINEPSVLFAVTLLKPVPKSEDEKFYLEKRIQDTLDQIKIDTGLQQWILQEHKKSHQRLDCEDIVYDYIHNHTHCDNVFSHLKANLVEVFYGSLHASIKFNFDIEDEFCRDGKPIDKLNSLEQLCHTALENLEKIIPHSLEKKQIKVINSTIEVEYEDTQETAETVIIENIREVYGTLVNNEIARKRLLSKLHEKSITQFNTTKDIMNLLKTKKFNDVDKLQIKMAGTFSQKNRVNKINATYTLWPGRTRSLAHMNDADISQIYSYFKNTIQKKYISPVANYLTLNMPIFKNNIKLLEKISEDMETSHIHLRILLAIKENEGTIGDIIDILSGFNSSNFDINLSKEENETMERALHKLLKQVEDWMQKTFRQWKEQYDIILPTNILTRTEFEQFVSKNYRDIFHIETFDRKTFIQKAIQGELITGDQVWMRRHALLTGRYAHVGVYVEMANNGRHRIVHAQPSTVPSEAQIVSETIDTVLKKSDDMFVVRYRHKIETPYSPEEIRQRALICCEEPRLTFKYCGYYGNCETFASYICGKRSIKDLNIQGFKIAFEKGCCRKKGIANFLESLHSYIPSMMQPYLSEDLVAALHKRFNQRCSYNGNEVILLPENSDQITLNSHHSNEGMELMHFLKSIGLSHLESIFNDQDIDFELLLTLSEDDLEKKVGIVKLGERRKIINALKKYKERSASPSNRSDISSAYLSGSSSSQRSSSFEDSENNDKHGLENNYFKRLRSSSESEETPVQNRKKFVKSIVGL